MQIGEIVREGRERDRDCRIETVRKRTCSHTHRNSEWNVRSEVIKSMFRYHVEMFSLLI